MKQLRGKRYFIICTILFLFLSITRYEDHAYASENVGDVIYQEDGIEIRFKVNSQWETGFEGSFIIRNNSKQALENWRIKFKFNHEIASLWDAEIESKKNSEYLIKHPKWNTTIAVGGKAIIGFNGTSNGKINLPSDCSIISNSTETSKNEYSISYKVTSDWGDACNAEITIANHTKKAIEGWKLEFDYDADISQIWNAKIMDHKGNHYIIKNDGWNSVISPDSSVKIGFEAKPGNSLEPSNFKLISSVSDNTQDDDEFDINDMDFETDSDKDNIPDDVEDYIGTDKLNKDSDGDGISDWDELYMVQTDPLKKDSDDNGIPDDKEDPDQDGLNNLEEFTFGTNPLYHDTDEDEIKDKEEIDTYKTNPIEEDSDRDGIEDGDEILLHLNPLLKDSDQDGVLDCDEKINQTFSYQVECKEKPEIEKVTVNLNATGNISKQMEINHLYQRDYYSIKVAGLIGAPMEIETTSEFDSAELIFHYKDLPKNVKEEDLGIFWYNKDQGIYEEQASAVNKGNKTVSAKVTHFSTYLVIDKKQWQAVWGKPIDYSTPNLARSSADVSILIDNSKSIKHKTLENVKNAAQEYVNTLSTKDRIAVVSFDAYSAAQVVSLDKNKKKVIEGLEKIQISTGKTRTGETTTKGFELAIKELINNQSQKGQYVLAFCDEDMKLSQDLIELAKKNDIHLFVINVTEKERPNNFTNMILTLGGYYYNADTEDAMMLSAMNADSIIKTGIDMKDTDGDGLFDVYEKKGIQVSNGSVIKTDYKNADVDQDGLTDFQEMDASRLLSINESKKIRTLPPNILNTKEKSNYVIKDSDGDGLIDAKDPYPKEQYDSRFSLTAQYTDIPPNKTIAEAKKLANATYNKDTNQDPNHRETLKGIKNRAKMTIAGGILKVLPNATSFLNHFLGNSGKIYQYDAEKLIKLESVNQQYYKNLNELLNACEQMTMNNEIINIITDKDSTKAKGFKAAEIMSKRNNNEFDWWFSIGLAECGMTAKSTRKGNQYEIILYYYIQEMYDWEKDSEKAGGLVTDGEMYMLHHAGMAREYESRGLYTVKINWIKNQRFGTKDKPKETQINLTSIDPSILGFENI